MIEMDPLISVIVPIYNVGKYLSRCIDSILSQSYSNLEIILVDDGATDDSGRICDVYADQYKNIRVVHQENGGLSAARNSGLEIANGEYIAFVDSDDWILPHHIKMLYDCLVDNDVLLSICQSQKVHCIEDSDRISCSYGCKVLDKTTVMYEAFTKYKWWSVCDKLFHRSLFEIIRFPVGRINEDYAIIFYVFDKCNSIAVGAQITYCYYERQGSITTSGFNKTKFAEYINGIEVLDFIKTNYPTLTAPAENILITTCLKLLLCVANAHTNEYDEWKHKILSTVRDSLGSWIRNPYLLKKQKFLLIPACINFRLFEWISAIYYKLC